MASKDAEAARTRGVQEEQATTQDQTARDEQASAVQEGQPAVPATTAAATVGQPATPDEAGQAVRHPDGSMAPENTAENAIGTTNTVQ
jgi:hypothetical protein